MKITTIASVKAARPSEGRQVEYADGEVKGLALRVSPAGKKVWTLRYRNAAGEQRRLTIGLFPAVGLSQARIAALQTVGAVAGGADPAHAKRRARVEAKAGKLETVGKLLDQYMKDATRGRHRRNGGPLRESSLKLFRTYIEAEIRPRFGDLPIGDLTRAQVQQLVDDVGETAPGSARACHTIIRQAYSYANWREIIASNPARLVQTERQGERDRVLADDEVRAIWRATLDAKTMSDLSLSPRIGTALRLAMVTLQRGVEVAGIHTAEIDRANRIWTIPGERTKNHRLHVVPLSDLALELLTEAYTPPGRECPDKWSGFAFVAMNQRGHIPRTLLTDAMRKITSALKIDDARAHDFRRTGSTNITSERIGMSRFLISQVLNHTSDKDGGGAVTGVYDRNAYLAEKRRALDAWAALLREIIAGHERPSNVVPMVSA